MRKIRRLLIANRGEIAIRIARSARELGITTIAVYAEVDTNALHIRMADECFLLRSNEKEPYLDIEAIIKVCGKAKADAVHPGYGFLSENAEFASSVVDAGIIFVGPSAEAIRLMGDKLQAKALASGCGVPVVPGVTISDPKNAKAIRKEVEAIGFPVLIKARAGGGGKGMRLVEGEEHLTEGIQRAISEAKDAFGDGTVFIEKFIQNPRHIEIQLLADAHGNVVHLFERECSIQRRHQKVIEEAPSTAVSDALREKMGAYSLILASACQYENAGTVEFVLGEEGQFYFLEMNTRLQVEHPVTEGIVGLDIVKEQIRIAEGHPLPFKQQELSINGHAIELRVYAEDPSNGFLPDTGVLRTYKVPRGIGVRLDDGYDEGMEIPIEYDPLIAKLITKGANRKEAIEKMKNAITEYCIRGVKNTLSFGRFVMNDQDFVSGNINTNFVATKMDSFLNGSTTEKERIVAALVGHQVANEGVRNVKTVRNHQNSWRNRLK
jgi:acetyl-CoA carboxylase biotin carboxylase subunit